MGLNKRFVNIESIIRHYQDGGLQSIDRWLNNADILIIDNRNISNYIVNKFKQRDYYGAQLIIEYELYRQGLS